MSRSALWRQEGNVKERQKQADEIFRGAVEAGRNNRAKNLLPLWGADDSFQLNPMLLQNIIQSQYFQKCCRDISDWNALVDEIYYKVDHLEPWSAGGSKSPSTAFCLLLRFLTLRCTEKQMNLTLQHPDSPYIRALGFLYIRFAGSPETIWEWIEPYLYDDEPLKVQANAAKQGSSAESTVGDFVRSLFSTRDYYGTILPRVPIQIERELQVKLLQAEKTQERAEGHAKNPAVMSHFQKVGSKVLALYGDDENPVQWYEAVVDRVITTDRESSAPLRYPKFVVTFPEYGNTETILLGEMEMPGAIKNMSGDVSASPSDRHSKRGYDDRRSDRDNERGYRSHPSRRGNDKGPRSHVDDYRDRRGYDRGERRSRDRHYDHDEHHSSRPGAHALPSEDDLYEEVRRRERETVTASNRHAVARRPPTTKTSLMAPSSDRRHRSRSSSPQRSPSHHQKSPSRNEKTDPTAVAVSAAPVPPKKRSPEELAAIQAKKQKLLAKYG